EALVRGLSTHPSRRFPSMRELLTALAFDPARDIVTAPRVRRWLTLIIPSFVILTVVARVLSQKLGVAPRTASLAMSVASVVFFAVVPFRFRRTLLENSFHRGIMIIGLSFCVELLFFRIAGMFWDLGLPQILTLDLVACMAMTRVMAAVYFSRLW